MNDFQRLPYEFLEACRKCNIETVHSLIENVNHSDELGNTGLILSSWNGHQEIVEILLNNNASLDEQNKWGWSALMWSSMSGYFDIVKLLCENGASNTIKNNDGDTAYDLVALQKNIPLMYFFNNEIINEQDEAGNTFLYKACRIINEDNILFLYERGADFFHENIKGVTPHEVLCWHKDLSGRLQALKEKLMLDKILDDDISPL